MKNKYVRYIITLLAVIIFTANPGLCAQAAPIKQTVVKFLIAMGGVALSSIIIFAGLTIYNKFFSNRKSRKFSKEDTLATPNTIEDAVTFFIKKNKLR